MSPLPLPPGARPLRLDVPGGPLAAVEVPARTGAAAATVVLVPGFTGSKEDFRAVLAPLAADGRRTVAIDQRGQYESPGPQELSAYGVEELAADLLAVVDLLGDGPVHLVGHSFGGLVSRAAALKRPEAVHSLTLLGSGPAALTGPRVEVLPLMAPVLEAGGMPALVEAVEAMNAADPKHAALPEQVRAFLRVRMLASAPAALLGMAEGLTGEPDRVAELRSTGVPVLVAHGAADDAWLPAVQADMAERLGAAYAVVPDALHSPALENPAATVAALREFFTTVQRRP
jgi:pimeloyl-ACP methyl ester carboxylesterase